MKNQCDVALFDVGFFVLHLRLGEAQPPSVGDTIRFVKSWCWRHGDSLPIAVNENTWRIAA